MKNFKRWAEDVKNNKEKYIGLKKVKDILKVAHQRGYNITEKEVLNFGLSMISGGGIQFGSNTTTNTHKENKNATNLNNNVSVKNSSGITLNISTNTTTHQNT